MPRTTIKLLLSLLYIVMAASLCLDPSQPQGQCSECPPTSILIDGSCYARIRGCLRHLAGPSCQECQFGYVLSQGNCIR